MAQSASTRRHTVIGAVGLAVLLGSGMVLATAWLIDVPASVLLGASAVAAAVMTVVLISAYRASRSSGTGVPRAIARRLNELRKFCRDFF
jgi:hypothetical protein